MSIGLLLGVLGLAAYRLTRFITTDDVPLGKIRGSITHRLKTQGRYLIAFGLECDWCVGVWVSGALVGIVNAWFYPLALPFLVFLAVASIVGIIGHLVKDN